MSSTPAQTRHPRQPGRVLMLARRLNVSGAAGQIRSLGKGLIEHNIEVAIAAGQLDANTPRGREYFEDAGFQTFQFDIPSNRPALNLPAQIRRSTCQLEDICDQFQPDLIHVHAPTLCMVAQSVAARRRLPMVTTFHLWPESALKRLVGRTASRLWADPYGQRVIAISSAMREKLINKLHVPKTSVTQIFNGVDAEHFIPPSPEQRRQARAEFDLREDQLAICLVANFEPRKNHRLLIQAIKLLCEKHIPVVALFAGEATVRQRRAVERQIDRAGVQAHVRLLGFRDSRSVYWACDVCVLPSYVEGFALVIPEAMLSGVIPLRTPAEGAYDQIEDGETGYIVPFGDPRTLANRLARIAGDQTLRQKLAANARAYAREHFTHTRMNEQTLAAYYEALSQIAISGGASY